MASQNPAPYVGQGDALAAVVAAHSASGEAIRERIAEARESRKINARVLAAEWVARHGVVASRGQL